MTEKRKNRDIFLELCEYKTPNQDTQESTKENIE